MHKSSEHLQHELYFALYMLKTRFHAPKDLLIYWSFAGPCLEPHPAIEDIGPRT
jgi:hypothetical protein